MKYVYICPQCKVTYIYDTQENRACGDCGTLTQFSGYTQEEWYSLAPKERETIKHSGGYISPACEEIDDGRVYSVTGVRGRNLIVYEDKCVITTTATIGSLITGNATDGEKTIYYVDCVGVQFKPSGFAIGYLQLETAAGTMNNKGSNFFSENTFTYDESTIKNEEMNEVVLYIKQRIDAYKKQHSAPVATSAPISIVDEMKQFKELLDLGLITQEEFDAKKKQLLGL